MNPLAGSLPGRVTRVNDPACGALHYLVAFIVNSSANKDRVIDL